MKTNWNTVSHCIGGISILVVFSALVVVMFASASNESTRSCSYFEQVNDRIQIRYTSDRDGFVIRIDGAYLYADSNWRMPLLFPTKDAAKKHLEEKGLIE